MEITRGMSDLLTLLLFVLPLGLDTFAIAAAVGANWLLGWSRWRISAIFIVVEGGTPLIGLSLGSSAGHAVGSVAEYLSGGLLILLGSYLWWSDADHEDKDKDDEAARARRLINARGLTLVGLALSISLDELAMGFSFGLGANLAEPTGVIAVIACQALVVSQLGLSLGARTSAGLRELLERLVGPILILIGLLPLAGTLMSTELVPPRGIAIVSILMIILAAIAVYRRFATRMHTVAAIPASREEGE
jgi:manganese efflux pump family protein